MSTEELIFDQVCTEAERSFSFADTLDLKANVWLVVITFLATQTAYFTSKSLTPFWFYAQLASAGLLILAASLTLIELCPRTYCWFGPSNGAIESRLAELREHYKGHESAEKMARTQLLKDQVEWARERAIQNKQKNEFKSMLIVWAFWLTLAAFGVNLITLLSLFKLPS